MTWVKLDDGFPSHPKLAEVGPLGLAMQVAALCYCNRYLTDGYVPRSAAATMLDFDGIGLINGMQGEDADWRIVTDLMVECELWDEVPGGFQIHDYLDYQPSKDMVLSERAKKKAAGQAGGRASAQARTQAPAEASVQAEGQAESNPVPVPDPVPKPGLEKNSLEGVAVDVHKELLVTRLLARLGDIDGKALADIRKLSEQLPPAALVKVHESLETRRLDNPVGYALNALRSELREAAVA